MSTPFSALWISKTSKAMTFLGSAVNHMQQKGAAWEDSSLCRIEGSRTVNMKTNTSSCSYIFLYYSTLA